MGKVIRVIFDKKKQNCTLRLSKKEFNLIKQKSEYYGMDCLEFLRSCIGKEIYRDEYS